MKYKKSIIVAVVVICGVIFGLPIATGIFVGENENRFEISNYISQIITNLFVVSGVIVALWQYIIYSRSEIELRNKEIYDMDKARIQKAIDLSEYFKDNIIKNTFPLSYVFQLTAISKIMDKIPKEKIKLFNNQELRQFLSEDDLGQLKGITKTKEFKDALAQICLIDDAWNSCANIVDIIEDEKPVKKVTLKFDSVLYKYQTLLVDTLNNLEYFAMHFIYETADESVVYQSLHRSYLQTMEMLYYDISVNNNGLSEKKYYTNAIKLYTQWKEEASKQIENEYATADENIRVGNKPGKRIK